ncbi:FMN-binding protein, partial [Micromonospora psammae]|uniref:FMN-binding protein n=1 Tax=Micromonospora sp. CPCC 205556 TaxID=3122398 RepID=UPI002FEE8BFA
SPTAAARGAAPSAKPTAGRTPSGTRGTTAAPRTTTAAPRTTRAAPPKSTTRTVFGPEISYEYGTATVQITVTGNKIVNAIGYLPEGGQSAQRSSKVNTAYSGIEGDVVDLQSANLDTVTTATATSDAYKRSLQGAIDRAF